MSVPAYLLNNALVNYRDYVKTFCLSAPTARKLYRADLLELGKPRMTAAHFYTLHGSFPAGFTPVYGKAKEKP